MNQLYRIERLKASIDVETYIEEYVNVEEFLECCKACPNYNNVWSCPPYDFDVMEYWRQYKTLEIYGIKMIFTQEALNLPPDELAQKSLFAEKRRLTEELWAEEKKNPGAMSLSAGSCQLCEKCGRPDGIPCVNSECMRYSIESIGGNVGKTCTKLLRQELLWCEEGKNPEYYILVGGLLKKW